MLDDDHGVALFDQLLQHSKQYLDVFEMKPRGGLVEDVKGVPGGLPEQLGGQFHPL